MMTLKNLIIAFITIIFVSSCNSIQKPMIIDINETQTFQKMEGFGASFTDSSAWLLYNVLQSDERNKIMRELFSYDDGIGISFLRQPMGASDFALKDYTYADKPEDYSLEHFSIDYDEAYIIPLLKEALIINPYLNIMGTPWSAPAWMKNSNNITSGELKNELYETYSKYFLKYVQAYAKHNIPIHAITLQNEPHHEPCTYPCMRMKSIDQARLAKFIGERFQKYAIKTKIIIWDHNWDKADEAIKILNVQDANPYIAGSAFHGYAGDVSSQSKVFAAYPNKDIYFTECSGGGWSTDFSNNLVWDVSTLIVGATRHWAKTVVKWNIALDENCGPQNGGCSNCRGVITVNQNTRNIIKNVEYYSLGHISKFVIPGARRIYSTNLLSKNIQNVAFINPNGLIVLIVLNSDKNEHTIEVNWQQKNFKYLLPNRSVVTFVWSISDTAVNIWLTTGDQKKLLEKQIDIVTFSE